MSIYLMKHNIPTYDKLVERLKTEDSVAVVQATGTGKSYITLKYIEEHCNGEIAIIVPTNVLADYWLDKADSLKNAKLTLYTYTALANCTDKQLIEIANKSDLLILDEMHRTGAERWGNAVKTIITQLVLSGKRTIGLTATPVRSLDNNKNVVDELFDGRMVKGLDLKHAILNGVLPPFNYVAALYDIGDQIDEAQSRILKTKRINPEDKKTYSRVLGALKFDNQTSKNIKDILEKHLDMSKTQKIILFARDIKEKYNLQEFIKEWFPTGQFYDVDSTMSRDACTAEINNFNHTNKGINIVTTVGKLNEGVHLEGVTSLIMLRRTQSNVIFFQQLGRALDAANKDNDIVVFDLVGNYKEVRTKNTVIDFIGFINDKRRADGKSMIVSDYTKNFLDILDEINARLVRIWTDDEIAILKKYYPIENMVVAKRLPTRTLEAVKDKLKDLGIYVPAYILWSDKELAILKKYYPLEDKNVIKRLPGRDWESIRRMTVSLGIHVYKNKPWTDEETAILIKYYPIDDLDVYKRLDDRPIEHVKNKLINMGIYVSKHNWSDEEKAILIKYYPTEGSKAFKRLKNRTYGGCIAQVDRLGLGYGCKNDWSDDELNILRKNYPKKGGSVTKMLPGRSREKCNEKAEELGIEIIRDWTDSEVAILRKYYPLEGGKVSKRLANRSHLACITASSKYGVYFKPTKRVTMVAPNGTKTIFDSALEAGQYIIDNSFAISNNPNSVATSIRGPGIKLGKVRYGHTWYYTDQQQKEGV